MQLKNKTAIITGAAQGIGAAIAERFVTEGARVMLTDVNQRAGEALAAKLSDAGEVRFTQLDVLSTDQWAAVTTSTTSTFGSLDILVNNAGVYERLDVLETTEEDWDRIMDINAKGSFLGARAVIPAMQAGQGGSIVNLSSTSGLRGVVSAAYASSKGAVRLFTKSVAMRYAKDGIRCNSVHPGPVATDMGFRAVPEAVRAQRLTQMPIGRFGEPAEIASAVLFLASSEASFITGAELVVDGGMTAA